MTREFRCPLGHAMRVPVHAAGLRVRCPICFQMATVPPFPEPPDDLPVALVPAPVLAAEPPADSGVADPRTATSAGAPAARTTGELPHRAIAAPAQATEVPAHDAEFPPLRRPKHRSGWAAGEANYRAIVHAIAMGMLLLSALQALPMIQAWRADTPPMWCWLLAVFIAAQVIYAVWLVLVPDWTTLRVAMFGLAGVSSLYSALAAIVVCTPRSSSLVLELDNVREPARLWCTVVMILATIVTYAAGHASFAWRRQRHLSEQAALQSRGV